MKKNVNRIMSMILVVMVMIVATKQNILAATYAWSSVKNPGTTGSTITDITMPLYKGKITFKVNDLSGNCSCLYAQVASRYEMYGYINTSSKDVKITLEGGEQGFYMLFTESGLRQDDMFFRCSMVHNASIGELVTASGVLSY